MAYLHMKHCKRDLYTNISPEMKPEEEARWETGDPLAQEMLDCLHRWRIQSPLEETDTVAFRKEREVPTPVMGAVAADPADTTVSFG
jgi:hypothetical protein